MALKDLLKATTYDRYTQDGRDKLNEALAEDVRYKTGDISQKTGLQKQPDGSWAPPKKGGNPGAKSGEGTLKPSRKPDQKKNPHIKNPDVLGMTANGARKRMEAFGAQFVENKNGKDYFKTTSGDLVEVEYGDNKKVLSSTTYTGGEKPEQVYPTTAGHNIESYINKLHEEGWKNDGWERNSANGALGYFKKGDKTIRVMQNWNGTLGGVSEIKPKAESKPVEEKPERYNYRAALEKGPKDAFAFEGTVTHSIPMSAEDKEQLANIKSFMKEENSDYKDAIKSVATGLVNGNKLHGDWYPEREESVLKIAKAVGLEDELKNYIAANHKGYDFGYSEDAAPRLTGDTRLRLSQVTDKVYQIGEISQKTGLQKTANGWRPVKKGADQKWMEKKEKKTAKEIMSKAGPGRTFELKMGENGQPTLGKEVKTYETRKEAREALKKQKAESKPAVKLGDNADTYNFDDPGSMSDEDKVFKSLTAELDEKFGDRDGRPGNVETWANAWLDNTQYEGGLGIKSRKTGESYPVSSEEVMKIVEENPARWNRIIGNAKKFYEGKGRSTDFESDEFYPIKLVGGKTKPSAQYYAESKRTKENARQYPLTAPRDAAPRELTGDCKIRVRRK